MRRAWPPAVRDVFVDRAAQIGFATQIFWASGLPTYQAWIIPAFILPGITLGQVEFAFDEAGTPEAVLSWACVTSEVSAELASNPSRTLHISEWNEGADLWIAAAFGAPGRAAALVHRMAYGPFAPFDRIRGIKRGLDGTPVRVLDLLNPARRRAVHLCASLD